MSKAMKQSCIIVVSLLVLQLVVSWNLQLPDMINPKPDFRQQEGVVSVERSLDEAIQAALTDWQSRAIPVARPLPRLESYSGISLSGIFPEINLRGTSFRKGRSSAVIDIPMSATGLVVQPGSVVAEGLVVKEIGFDFIELEWQGRRKRFQLNGGQKGR